MFKDNRGRGKYDVFPSVPDGQVNVSYSYPGTIRAFHRHKNQWDHWFVVKGNLEVVLVGENGYKKGDPLTKSMTYEMQSLCLGEGEEVSIPPNIWHGFRVLGQEESILLYYVTNKYNPEKPDEERAEWNAFYDWETSKK